MKIKILLAGLLCASAFSAQAAVYYVDGATGSDSNNCTSWTAPCKTVGHAASIATTDSDIRIAKGVYKLSSQITVSGKNLRFIGGYTAGISLANTSNPYLTIFSGDSDNNDTVDARGVTKVYTDINGTNATRAFQVSVGDFTFANMTITGFKHTAADEHGIAIYYANSTRPENTLTLDNVAVVGNSSPSLGTVMMHVVGPTNQGQLVIINSIFDGNQGASGSAVTIHNNVTKALIENTIFQNNSAVKVVAHGWDRAVAALYIQTAASEVTIIKSIFSNNTATNGAGAIYSNSPLTVENSSFDNNTVANQRDDNNVSNNNCAGAVTVKAKSSFLYNTFYKNTAAANCAGGIRNSSNTSNKMELMANLLLENTPSNIETVNDATTDVGYNILGSNNNSKVVGTFTKATTSIIPAAAINATDIVETEAKYWGGNLDANTVRIKKGSLAHNAVPNDSVPFYGVGKSVEAPFVSLQQARGALGRDDYPAGLYYFDIGGVYDVNNGYAFVSGSNAFSATVDKQGWVQKSGLTAGEGVEQTKTEGGETWVRGGIGFCSGTIATDVRGLPRSDKVEATDPLAACDIGAFEFNDYFKVDCEDEDGERPENTLESAQVSWCFSPFDGVTPQDILENMGSFQWYWSLLLIGLYGIRRKPKN